MLQSRFIASVRSQRRRSRAVLSIGALIFLPCIPTISWAQTLHADVRVNQEVRVYNDIDRTMVKGRVAAVTAKTLNVVRHMDTPALRIPWTDIHRLEVKSDSGWKSVQLAKSSDMLSDSSWAAGSVAGAAAARAVKSPGYFAPAFLSGLPLGFFGAFMLCWECDATPKAFAGAGMLGMSLTIHAAGARARKFPASLQHQIEGKSDQYRAGFQKTYEARLASRLRKEAWAGAILGTVAGFGGLVYAFRNYD